MGFFDNYQPHVPAERATWYRCPKCGSRVPSRRWVKDTPHFNELETVWAISYDGPDWNNPEDLLRVIKEGGSGHSDASLYKRLCYGGPSAEWVQKFGKEVLEHYLGPDHNDVRAS